MIARVGASIGVLALSLLLAREAEAQATTTTAPPPSSPSTQDNSLQEIVVTAQRRTERLEDVPIAVTALTARDLAASNINAQVDLPKVTPDLTFTAAASLTAPYIRGVGTSFVGPGLDSSVPVYLDDMYIPRAASAFFNFNDVERVEMLKGPQGTLFGRNAGGGAIHIITNDPDNDYEAAAGVTYGSFNRVAVDGMINIPFNDSVAFGVAYRHDQNDGYVHNINPTNPSTIFVSNQDTVKARLLIHPPKQFDLKLDFYYSRQGGSDDIAYPNYFRGLPEQLGVAFGGCVGKTFYDACINVKPFLALQQYGGSIRVNYDLGFAKLSSISAIRHASDDERADPDATGANLLTGTGRAGDNQFSYTSQETQEFQLASNGSGRLTYVAGLYYLWDRSEIYSEASGITIGPDLALVNNAPVRTNSISGYAQADLKLTNTLTLTLGGRYTDETKRLLCNETGAGPTDGEGSAIPSELVFAPERACTSATQTLCAQAPTSVDFTKFTPKVTLSYKPIPHPLVMGPTARASRAVGLACLPLIRRRYPPGDANGL